MGPFSTNKLVVHTQRGLSTSGTMTAVFMHGDDVEWTLLDDDDEVFVEADQKKMMTTTAEKEKLSEQQQIEGLRAELERKEAELFRTREELRVARLDLARAAAQSASAARLTAATTQNNNNPHIRDGRWYASFPPTAGASVSEAPVLVAVCTGCGYAKPADLLGVSFHEGISRFNATRKIPSTQPRFKCSRCDARRTRPKPAASAAAGCPADDKLDQLLEMGFDLETSRIELRRSGGDVETALRVLLA